MRDIERVLVAIDLHRDGLTLTAGSCIAMDQAVELAKRIGCSVVLLHAMGRHENGATARMAALDVRACAQRTLEREARRFRSLGVEAQIALRDEPAWLAIVHEVLRARIDLVIAGRRNERSQSSRGIGSVSARLVHECPCAVWVAKLGSAVAPRRVLAASDLSPVGERVIEHAAFLAGRYGAALHVVHAFRLPVAARLDATNDIEQLAQRERAERERRLAEQLARADAGSRVELHVVRAAPLQALLDSCKRLEPDLVVMGTLSRGGLGRTLGRTALRLLARLDVSLLTVKPDDFVCPVAIDA